MRLECASRGFCSGGAFVVARRDLCHRESEGMRGRRRCTTDVARLRENVRVRAVSDVRAVRFMRAVRGCCHLERYDLLES